MFCKHCGKQVADGFAFCDGCGARMDEAVSQNNVGMGTQTPVQGFAQNNQGFAQNNQGFAQNNQGFAQSNQGFAQNNQGFAQGGMVNNQNLPMNWFKFLIYFALFFGAFANLVYGILYLSGGVYSMSGMDEMWVEMFYDIAPGAEFADKVYGVLCLALAGAAIFVRFQLAGYSAKGPMLLYAYYALGVLASILRTVLFVIGLADAGAPAEIFDMGSLFGSVVGSIIGTAICILLNKMYFDKRKHLFVK